MKWGSFGTGRRAEWCGCWGLMGQLLMMYRRDIAGALLASHEWRVTCRGVVCGVARTCPAPSAPHRGEEYLTQPLIMRVQQSARLCAPAPVTAGAVVCACDCACAGRRPQRLGLGLGELAYPLQHQHPATSAERKLEQRAPNATGGTSSQLCYSRPVATRQAPERSSWGCCCPQPGIWAPRGRPQE